MDIKKIGTSIYNLRKSKNMTQKQLADLLNISDKTISKWERGLGYPDISFLPELSSVLCVSIDDIFLGETNLNEIIGGNMRNLKFYVCDKCNNILTSTADASISCCGKKLEVLIPKKADDKHKLNIEPVEDELYVTSEHDMKKEHYISFLAYVKGDSVFIVKQYPEWNLQTRLRKQGHGKLYFYCNNDGLFYQII